MSRETKVESRKGGRAGSPSSFPALRYFDHRCGTFVFRLSTFVFRRPHSCTRPLRALSCRVLINLVPEFLDVLRSPDSAAAYRRYHDNHRLILDAYWRNYVLDPDSHAATEVIHNALRADRRDLYQLLEQRDIEGAVEEAMARAREVLRMDRPADVYLMVGMGAANAGEAINVTQTSNASTVGMASPGHHRSPREQIKTTANSR